MKDFRKVLKVTSFMILTCFVYSGCSKKETSAPNPQIETEITELAAENETENTTEGETDTVANNKRTLTIPQNKKDEEELFGTTDKSGHWTPPESSYTDPKTGTIYNKEGVVIGSTRKNITPDPNAVG